MRGNPYNTKQMQEIIKKYETTYRANAPRWIDPDLLASMTPLEAMVILEDQAEGLYSGGSGGGPVANEAWNVMWDLAEQAGDK